MPASSSCARLCTQVRNAQLDKEASELRAENETLLRAAEEAKHSAVQSAQVRSGGGGSGGGGGGASAQRMRSALLCNRWAWLWHWHI